MFHRTTGPTLLIGGLALCTAAASARAETPAGKPVQNTAPKPASSRVVRSQVLSPLDGSKLRASLSEITYAPGGASPAHSHPCPVMVYVIEGAIRTQIKGEPEAIYRAGDTFYESANGVHEISANASDTAPARFLAFFVCDRDTPLAVPSASAGAR